MQGTLWREDTIQGRCQPGRRAVLEETKEPSDLTHSTLNKGFSQVLEGRKPTINSFRFSQLHRDFFSSQRCGRVPSAPEIQSGRLDANRLYIYCSDKYFMNNIKAILALVFSPEIIRVEPSRTEGQVCRVVASREKPV